MNAAGPGRRTAFTLVELMVSVAVIALLVVALAEMTHHTSTVWRRSTGKIEQFREARAGFEAMTTRLGQATLNTYWDYDNVDAPTRYERRSELRFISGPVDDLLGGASPAGERLSHAVFFQAPLGVTEAEKYRGFENLLCTWGYYLEYGDDRALRPHFLTDTISPPRYRTRLMELWQPAEANTIYAHVAEGGGPREYRGRDWFAKFVNRTNPPVHAIAENVIALVVTPRLAQVDEEEVKGGAGSNPDESPLAPEYLYDSSPPGGAATDSRYANPRLNPASQLPPVLQVTLVAIDERTAVRLELGATTADLFEVKDRFRKSADYSRDLLRVNRSSGSTENASSLEAALIARRANYRIFNTNVVVRGAKWSSEQTN